MCQVSTFIVAGICSLIRILEVAEGHLQVVMVVVGGDENERDSQEAQKCGEKLHRVEKTLETGPRSPKVIQESGRG